MCIPILSPAKPEGNSDYLAFILVLYVKPRKVAIETFAQRGYSKAPKVAGPNIFATRQPAVHLVESVKVLSFYNLSFDLCVLARQLPVAINIARRFPNVTFIPDHRGVPQVKENVLEPRRRDLREISRLPNVNRKISCLVTYADPVAWTPEDLRPYVEHALECFVWQRVMFGSDWPVCTISATLGKRAETLSILTQNESPESRRKLFRENAQKVYRVGISRQHQ